jgi:phosphomannomutase/cytidine deaminase
MESSDPNPKLELLQAYGVTLGDVVRLNRFAIIESKQTRAPYSGVKIGAALLTEDDNIYTGQYIEDLVYGNSITAEDFAMYKALSEGKTKFKAMSIYYENKNGQGQYTIPNGKWRQKNSDYFILISCKSEENYILKSSASLVPYSYNEFTIEAKLFFPNKDNLKEVLNAAAYWLQIDHDETTRREVEALMHNENIKELTKIFSQRLQFGTAGLRCAMRAGYANMNYVTIQQTTQGLSKYLLEQFGIEECGKRGVVVGYDGRHNSFGFAHITAATFKFYGIRTYLYDRMVCTPMVPYFTRKFKCVAGVMVTASHNPKQDNGYKLYWENSAQIVSPHEANIAASIAKNLEIEDLSEYFDYVAKKIKYKADNFTNSTINSYINEIEKTYFINTRELNKSCPPITYTAMHGVGYPFIVKVMATLGFQALNGVKEQIDPDPEFSTVDYPNPEEGKGALKLAMEQAERGNSKFIIANDPDADRLAIAEKQEDGTWKIFTGDEIGAIMANFLFQTHKRNGDDVSKFAMVASTVSSKMLGKMAQVENFRFEEVLTGFKWIANKNMELDAQGYQTIFSYEEAIGFCCGSIVRDKDGVCAAAVICQLYAQLCSNEDKGGIMNEYLQNIYKKYGYFVTRNHYFKCYDPVKSNQIFDEIREGGYPEQCGPYKIKYIRDLTNAYDNSKPDNKPVLPISKSSQMITFTFENGTVITLRNSGTEPKLKYYCEYNDKTPEEARRILDDLVLNYFIPEFLQPEKFGLE